MPKKRKFNLDIKSIQAMNLISVILGGEPDGTTPANNLFYWLDFEDKDQAVVYYDSNKIVLQVKETMLERATVISLYGAMSLYNGQLVIIDEEEDYDFDDEDDMERLSNIMSVVLPFKPKDTDDNGADGSIKE